jgi:hypothetical protein
MSEQIDYQILLQEIVKTARAAAASAKDQQRDELLFGYYDILDVVKTQAEIMDVPLTEIGLDGFDPDQLLSSKTKA